MTDSEGNVRTFSIASPPLEEQPTFATRMRDTAFKRSLKVVLLSTEIQIAPPSVLLRYTRMQIGQRFFSRAG